jgi:hypothetical protein
MRRILLFAEFFCRLASAQDKQLSVCEAIDSAQNGDRVTVEGSVTGEFEYGQFRVHSNRSCGRWTPSWILLIPPPPKTNDWAVEVQRPGVREIFRLRGLLSRQDLTQHQFVLSGTVQRNHWWWACQIAELVSLCNKGTLLLQGRQAFMIDLAPVALVMDGAKILAPK